MKRLLVILFTVFTLNSSFSIALATDSRFIDKGNGTIYDTISDLTWLKNASCYGLETWSTAKTSANILASGRCDLTDGSSVGDWHLPSLGELSTLKYATHPYITLNAEGFNNVRSEIYWSSSTYGSSPPSAYYVSMMDGDVNAYYQFDSFYVWPVRSGQWPSLSVSDALNLGNQNIGQAGLSKLVHIFNTGSSTQAVTSITLTGTNADEFSIVPSGDNPCASLAPTLAAKASCTLNLGFLSVSKGNKTANLTITADGKTLVFPIIGTSFTTVMGTLTDLSTGNKLTDASITITGGTTTQSDKSGNFIFNPQPANGIYTVTITKSGYSATIINNVIISDTTGATLKVGMVPSGILNFTTASGPLYHAEIGVAYNQSLWFIGGTSPYTFSKAYGTLSPGLTIDPSLGTISGTPTTIGNYIFAMGLTDQAGAYAEREFSIEVTAPLVVTSTTLARGTQSAAYSTSIAASGGKTPYSYLVSTGSLPSGLVLAAATGTITGAPLVVPGSYNFNIQVRDASGRTATNSFSIVVDAPLSNTTSRLNDGIVGSVFNQTLTATGGFAPYTWGVRSGTLPVGLSLNTSTGIISGTPTIATTQPVEISVQDSYNRVIYKQFTINAINPLQILTTAMPNAHVGDAFSELIRTNGGVGPYTFSYTGLLPSGLTLSTTTGKISGTPTSAGYVNLGLTVTDSSYPTPQSVTQSLGIRTTSQLTITSTSVLTDIIMGAAMNQVTLTAVGGTAPFSWTIVGGALPPGVTLNTSTGIISGTPTTSGDYIVTIRLADSAGSTTGTSSNPDKQFFIHVSIPPLSVITATVPSGVVGVPYGTTLAANGGSKPYIWSIAIGTLPSGLILNSASGAISGIPTAKITSNVTFTVSDSDTPPHTAQKIVTFNVTDPLPVAGVCGSSNNGNFTIAPTTNLCTTGTASAVTGTGPWNWTCSGSSGGTTATCNAILQKWTINTTNSGSGTVSCTSPVNNGATSTCIVTIATGYQLATFTDNSIDKKSFVAGGTYSITNVTANHSITATFSPISPTLVNGVCGSSNGAAFTIVPATNLCTTGAASSVTGSGPWSWTCAGINGGTTATCGATILNSTAPPAPIPQTGQTTCYNRAGTVIACTGTGQDGDEKAGVAWPNPRFTDNGNGTVNDNLTGLIWTKDANAPGPTACNPATGKNWQGALDHVACLNSNNYLGYSDWRVPTNRELGGLVDISRSNPALPAGHPFTSVQSNYYWSGSTYAGRTDNAWYVYMYYGYMNPYPKTGYYIYVWPVRSGQLSSAPSPTPKTGQTTSYFAQDDGAMKQGIAWPSPRFTDNANGSVTDNLTGLVWLKNANCFSTQTWEDAVVKANTLASGTCGLTDGSKAGDWLLPNKNELWSLVDYGRSNPALPANHPFTVVQYNQQNGYGSGSTYAGSTAAAWDVSMDYGYMAYAYKDYSIYNYVWPIRSGQSGTFGSLILSVNKTGTGSGTITTNTGTITWTNSTGSASYASGTAVTLTAAPATGSSFTGWSGSCSGTGACTVTMDAAKSVTATFAPLIQAWTINTANSGSGTVSCTSPVNNGATSTCTVTPATDYQLATFTDNSIDKKSAVTGGSYSLTNVTASHAIVATFSPTKPKVFLGANDNFTINTSGTTLYGNTGNNTATIATGTTGVTLDQNIGGINLTGTAGSYKFKQTGNIINVYDTTDNLIVSAPVQGDSDGTVLSFTNGITSASAKLVGGVMKLGGATVSTNTATIITPVTTTSAATTPTTTNAKVFLGADNSFNVGNSGTTVYGNTGKGIVTIASGISGVNLDQNIERINFTGLSSSYKFKQTGNLINVYDTADTLIVKVPVQGDADGTILSFGNQGTASAKLSGGVMTLGGKTVSPIVATILTPTLTPL